MCGVVQDRGPTFRHPPSARHRPAPSGCFHPLTFCEMNIHANCLRCLSHAQVRKCEKPKHTVLRTLGQKKGWFGKVRPAAEVRLYSPYLLAEVTLSGGNMDKALSGGCWRAHQYCRGTSAGKPCD